MKATRTPFPFSSDDLKNTPNDSRVSTDRIVNTLQREGVEIKYGDLSVFVRETDLNNTRQRIAGYDAPMRQQVRASVQAALANNIPLIDAGNTPAKVFDDTYADLMIWQALKEIGN